MTAAQSYDVEIREGVGKGVARALRREGKIPAIIYGGKDQPVMITANKKIWGKEALAPRFFATIFDLNVSGKKHKVIAQDYQFDPVTDELTHLDFLRVKKGEEVSVLVPVKYINRDKSPGIKLGGILNVILRKLEIKCSIENIPEAIEIDLTGLPTGHSIRSEVLTLPNGCILARPDRDITVATIVSTRGSAMAEREGDSEGSEESSDATTENKS